MSGGQAETRLTREEIAQRDIGHTDISRRVSWSMIGAFLCILVAPPTMQLAYDLATRGNCGEEESCPSCGELFCLMSTVTDSYRHSEGGPSKKLVSANRQLLTNIGVYEKHLEERSLLTRGLLGPTQELLTRFGGVGNERTSVGNDGWLFFRPEVEYLTGPGFLDPAFLNRRERSGSEHTAAPQSDPRPAILEFHEQLAELGIRLILMPTPGKPMIHPEKLSWRFEGFDSPLQNSSFEKFKDEMQRAGVLVFDPAPLLASRKRDRRNRPQFLRTDTHWMSEAMQFVAGELRQFIEDHSLLTPRPAVELHARSLEVTNLGDTAAMLRLPRGQTLFPKETVPIRQIVQSDDQLWQPDRSADVLLLGDSFTNIYSLPEMNWGSAAGLAEQLSFLLQRPVDRLAQNDGGSHAVRQSLVQEMARGNDRLAGKQIVIWQFAARELAFGDWKRFPFPKPLPDGAKSPRRTTGDDTAELVVRGEVRAAAGAPQPGTVPYRDAVTGVHLVSVEALHGSRVTKELVVYLWGMRDNRLTSAAHFAPGQKVTLTLTPWDTVRERYERFNRIELDDPDFRLVELPTYWAEVMP